MIPPVAPIERERTLGPAFNGHAIRLCIASSSDYIAHPVFSEQVKWCPVSNTNNVLCYAKRTEVDGSPMPANLVIVGVVSSDRPHLGDLGNWNSAINMKLTEIKQQFTLKRPTGFVDFEDDFDIAVRRLTALQEAIAVKGSQQLWFVLSDDALRMSHRLFQEKIEIPDESSDMEDHEIKLIKEAYSDANKRASLSKQYLITDKDMHEPIKKVLDNYDLIPLEAYNRTNTLIPIKELSRSLRGALVQVIFNFHSSYAAFQKVTNFRGEILQVKILKNSTHVPLSPRKRGPIKLQTAHLRDDQVDAVNKFLFKIPRVVSPDSLVTVKDEPGNGTHNHPGEQSTE